MSGLVGWFGGFPVSAKIRTHNRESVSQERGDAVPRRMCPRMTVKQHHWGSRPTVADPYLDVAEVDPLQLEAIEHVTEDKSGRGNRLPRSEDCGVHARHIGRAGHREAHARL
jgi:hypothetical protein